MSRIIWEHLCHAVRPFPRYLFLAALAAGALLVPVRFAHAAASPEGTCQKGRHAAAAKYNACQQNLVGKRFGGGINKFFSKLSQCRVKYTGTWAKLAKKAAGTGATCDTTRFTDNGTTVTDNLTGLQWEKKTTAVGSGTNLGDPHDVDNDYTWSANLSGTAADGPAFTTFLPALNSGGCFAGHCDWRLPTIYELQTILSEAFPCMTSPCINPVFGPTQANPYWSATTIATEPDRAWSVFFADGILIEDRKGRDETISDVYVRAVRGGL